MKEFWNTRFAAENYAYGKAPNEFLKVQIDNLATTGKILFPAEGEGRNAVYAAQKGWEVEAFDISESGKIKALQLAQSQNVALTYQVGFLEDLTYPANSFDAIALIYAHVPPPIKANFYTAFAELLKPNGLIILEAFSTTNLPYRAKNPKIGGPDVLEMLFSIEEVKSYFPKFEILQLEDVVVTLNEGEFHNGTGKVIRFIGRKK
jgi:2-polyprenyl-3-methyl-5-hydroxy-6-metoxy-1,4-benzoquinol methylase